MVATGALAQWTNSPTPSPSTNQPAPAPGVYVAHLSNTNDPHRTAFWMTNTFMGGYATTSRVQTLEGALAGRSNDWNSVTGKVTAAAATGVDSIAIGTAAVASGTNAVAIGSDAAATNLNSVAIGTSAKSFAVNGAALGTIARVNLPAHTNSMALGYYAITTTNDQLMASFSNGYRLTGGPVHADGAGITNLTMDRLANVTKPDRWLILGDSNSGIFYGDTYWSQISNAIPSINVKCSAASGENAAEGMARLIAATNYFTDATRDTVSIFFGVNDLADGHSPELVATNIIALARAAETARVDQVIIIGYYAYSTQYVAGLRQVNEYLRRAAATSGWCYVDADAATVDPATGLANARYLVGGFNYHLIGSPGPTNGHARVAAAVLPPLLIGGPIADETYRWAVPAVATNIVNQGALATMGYAPTAALATQAMGLAAGHTVSAATVGAVATNSDTGWLPMGTPMRYVAGTSVQVVPGGFGVGVAFITNFYCNADWLPLTASATATGVLVRTTWALQSTNNARRFYCVLYDGVSNATATTFFYVSNAFVKVRHSNGWGWIAHTNTLAYPFGLGTSRFNITAYDYAASGIECSNYLLRVEYKFLY